MRRVPRTAPPLDRWIDKVEITGDCWLWTAATERNGYGVFTPAAGDMKQQVAHRFGYEHLVEAVPDGLELDHLCRVRNCVNPDHLEAVTREENIRRAKEARTHCKHDHEYTPENTLIGTRGERRCRTCNRLRNRAYYRDARQAYADELDTLAPAFARINSG